MSDDADPPDLTELRARQRTILELARQRGFVAVDGLARRFEVTAQTIRRDINDLCDRELLERYHGGAVPASSVENIAYDTRRTMRQGEKTAIARAVARRIPDRASLFINVGTTTESVARALDNHTGLRVITNNLNVATLLADHAGFEVIVAGGVVRPRDKAVIGEATIDFVNQFRMDIAVVGISGIDRDGSLLDFDYREVRVAQAIIRNARRVFLATDHTKFGRNAMARVGGLADVDVLFTDRPPEGEWADLLNAHDVEVVVGDESETLIA